MRENDFFQTDILKHQIRNEHDSTDGADREERAELEGGAVLVGPQHSFLSDFLPEEFVPYVAFLFIHIQCPFWMSLRTTYQDSYI